MFLKKNRRPIIIKSPIFFIINYIKISNSSSHFLGNKESIKDFIFPKRKKKKRKKREQRFTFSKKERKKEREREH